MVAPPAQPETFPAPSTARKRRLVLPSVAMVSNVPAISGDQVTPWSVDVWYWYPARPEPPASVEFEAVTVCDATFCQMKTFPFRTGVVGAVWSRLTVACTQPEALPAPSNAWKRTRVVPSAATATLVPEMVAADQVTPLSVDFSHWYPVSAEPPVSVELPAATVTLALFRHEAEPPVTVGALGAVRSMRIVDVTQVETFPAPSIERNRARVWPSSAAVTCDPAVTVVHVVPPSVDVWYW